MKITHRRALIRWRNRTHFYGNLTGLGLIALSVLMMIVRP